MFFAGYYFVTEVFSKDNKIYKLDDENYPAYCYLKKAKNTEFLFECSHI